jgi:hypothetical protein
VRQQVYYGGRAPHDEIASETIFSGSFTEPSMLNIRYLALNMSTLKLGSGFITDRLRNSVCAITPRRLDHARTGLVEIRRHPMFA